MSDLNYIGKTGIITYKTYNWPNVCMCVQLLCYEAHEYTEYIIYIHFPDLKNALKLSIPSRMKYWSEKKLGFYIHLWMWDNIHFFNLSLFIVSNGWWMSKKTCYLHLFSIWKALGINSERKQLLTKNSIPMSLQAKILVPRW